MTAPTPATPDLPRHPTVADQVVDPAGPMIPPEARWLLEAAVPWEQLVTFGPPGPAAARLRFVPDPDRPGQAEADVAVAQDHPSELAQTQRALHVLAAFTGAAGDCCFCLWDGYPYTVRPGLSPSGTVVLPHRRYTLYRAPLRSIDTFAADAGGGRSVAPPALVWPADHRWCFASDIDPHWAGISACVAAVDALLAAPGLDVVPADPAAEQPAYR